MKFRKIKQYDSRFGWNIVIEDLSSHELKSLERLLSNLGLKRNLKAEIRISKLSNFNDSKKYNKIIISKIFENIDSSFSYYYLIKKSFLAATWKSKLFDGEEFASLLLSNM